jgi:hypothetical protein
MGSEPKPELDERFMRQDTIDAVIPEGDARAFLGQGIGQGAELALGRVTRRITRTRGPLKEADVGLAEELRVVSDGREVQGAAGRELNRSRGRVLAALRG